jgi:hypothetical protein
MRLACSLVTALVAVGCSSASSEVGEDGDQALNDGRPTSAYPEVGFVVAEDGNLCTGTLISPQVVLTAAHCLSARVAFFTGAGAPFRRGELTEIPANMTGHRSDDAIAHPSWQGLEFCPSTADIGLIHLEAPITDITPAKLVRRRDVTAPLACVAVGYGLHDDGNGVQTLAEKRSGYMRLGELSGDAVSAQSGNAPPRTDGDGRGVTTPGEGTNAFTDQGDSGGPLRCNGKILAVTSCGRPGANDGWYTLTEPYEAWIDEQLERWDAPR